MKTIVIICTFLVVGVWYLGCMAFRENHYMDCKKIIVEHLKFLQNEDKSLKKTEFFNFFVIPLIISGILIYSGVRIDSGMAENVLVILSILLSSFFALIAVVLSIKIPMDEYKGYSAKEYRDIKDLVKAVTNALNFEILISIVIVLLNFLLVFTNKAQGVFSFVNIYLILVMILNLFVVLRNFSALVRIFVK